MTEEIYTKKEKITLKYCRECGRYTVHISKKVFNDVEYVSNITHRCLVCGNVTKKTINHNEFDAVLTPLHCANCGRIIEGRGLKVDDSMGMSGDIYYVCNKTCRDEFINKI